MMAEAQEQFVEFVIDDRTVQGRMGDSVLRTALDHGIAIPYYCWHPGMSVVASCRLCLVEMDDFDAKSGDLRRVPRLVPSCSTPVKRGIRVYTQTEKVKASRAAVMEHLLLNHPLDCPVCDQAGECWLQDYDYWHGSAHSRMIDPKTKQPKKDVGEHILLYADRCILCSRCVRFCREVSGGSEVASVNRGHRCEIDVHPGCSLEDKMSGNVADICPVGAFLDKEFLFRERVWYLQSAASVCSGCASGCTIWVDYRDEKIGRFRPRYNPEVNGYWMCDDGRYLWKQVYRDDRLMGFEFVEEGERRAVKWDRVAEVLAERLREFVEGHGRGRLAAVLSPMMDCETIYLAATMVRSMDPEAVLVGGPEPRAERNEVFRSGFTINAEKAPNGRGLRMILEKLGGPRMTVEALRSALAEGRIDGLWISGGYFDDTIDRTFGFVEKPGLLAVHDTYASSLSERADVVLPMTVWVEREGSFINAKNLVQPFRRAVIPPMGLVQDGQWLAAMVGQTGVYRASVVRKELAKLLDGFEAYEPPKLAKGIH